MRIARGGWLTPFGGAWRRTRSNEVKSERIGCVESHPSKTKGGTVTDLERGGFVPVDQLLFRHHFAGQLTRYHLAPTPTANSFPVVVFSDLHFDPFYDPTLFTKYPTFCTTAHPSQWESFFHSSQVNTASAWGYDTNYPLLVLALTSIRQNLGASPVVIYTGDLIGHNFASSFYQYCEGLAPSQTPSSQNIAAMQVFTDKTVTFVTAQIREYVGNLPVVFAVGNIDSYTGYGPDSTFLTNNAEGFYSQFVKGTVDHQTFLNTFTAGGYYSAQPLGSNLMVIALNTNPFAIGVPGDNDSAIATELAWLDSSLASAQAAGQKVWLLMHVPPGANTVSTAANIIPGQPQAIMGL